MPYRLRIRFDEPDAFRESFAANLAMGGAFVPTGDPLQLLTVVELEVSLAYCDQKLLLDAQVVHVVPPERALAPLDAGVAVAFLAPPEEIRKQLTAYLDDSSEGDGATERDPGQRVEGPDGCEAAQEFAADARFQPQMHRIQSERLSVLEASLLELATAGLPTARILEVIPEDEHQIRETLRDLVERGVLQLA